MPKNWREQQNPPVLRPTPFPAPAQARQSSLGRSDPAGALGVFQQRGIAANLAQKLEQRNRAPRSGFSRFTLAASARRTLVCNRNPHTVHTAEAEHRPAPRHAPSRFSSAAFGGHLSLGPAQKKRANPPGQQFALLVVVHDARIGTWKPNLRRTAGRTQHARHQKIEQAPQLAQMILQRRAGQTQSMPGAQLARMATHRGTRILDRLGLIENQQMIVVAGQGSECPEPAADKWSAPGHCRRSTETDPCAAGRVQQQDFQVRRKTSRLGPPVEHQAGRCNHQARLVQATGLFFPWPREPVPGPFFPSPMSSARMPPKPNSRKELQPAQPVRLVAAQFSPRNPQGPSPARSARTPPAAG